MPESKKRQFLKFSLGATLFRILQSFLFGLIFISSYTLNNTLPLSAQQKLIKLDPFSSGFDPDNPDSTFEHCVQNYLSGELPLPFKWFSGKKSGPHDCANVVGYHFKLVWGYVDPNPNERIVGKKTEKEDFAGEYIWPPGKYPAPYRFYVDYYLECAPPEFAVRAINSKIKVGEKSRILVRLKCGDEVMDYAEVKLTLSGPGRIETDTLRTDATGIAETTYYGTNCGIAEITAKYVNCKNGLDKSEISISIPVEVVGDCYYAKISGSFHEERSLDCTESHPGYSKHRKEQSTKEISGSLFLTFEDDVRVNYNKYENEYRWVLKVKDYALSSFSYSESGEEYSREEDAVVPHLSKEVTYKNQASASQAKAKKNESALVEIYFDGETKKAKRAYIRGSIEYIRNFESQMRGKERRSTPSGYRIFDMKPFDISRTTDLSFGIVPVEDNVKGPTGASRWHKDSEVTSGDGITSFGGQGKKTLPHNSECIKIVEESEYTWEMHMRKPSNHGR